MLAVLCGGGSLTLFSRILFVAPGSFRLAQLRWPEAAVGVVTKALTNDMHAVNARYDALLVRKEKLIADLGAQRLTDASVQDLLDFADNVSLGLENADYRTKRAYLEALKLSVVVREGRFYVSSIAGTWEGEIRKLPRAHKKDGANEVQFVPDFQSIAIFPNTDQDCRKISRGRE